MIHSKPPGTHLGRQRAVELSDPACIGIDSEKKKRGIVLTEGKVNGIQDSRFSRADESPPTGGLSHRYTEVLLSK
jgi:phosphatidate phosphatase PAH1